MRLIAIFLLFASCALGAKFGNSATRTAPLEAEALRPAAVETSRSMRGVAWLQETADSLCNGELGCRLETLHLALLLGILLTGICGVLCAFSFIREDKEEQLTPLCPQLVVRGADMKFRLPLDTDGGTFDVTGVEEPQDLIFKVLMDWTDPFKAGTSSVAASVKLQNAMDFTVVSVLARNVSVVGQSLVLCRAGHECFGFVEPDGEHRYQVRHRTGIIVLTLAGDFDTWDVDGLNPVGVQVCNVQRIGNAMHGRVVQHVDAGLVIASLLATRVHRLLTAQQCQSPQKPLSGDEEEGCAVPVFADSGDEAAPGSAKPDPFLPQAVPGETGTESPQTQRSWP